jgi:phosphate transport system substrate-binding protein
MKLYPDLTITVNKSGSGTGASALVDSRCDVATMSRPMKDKEYKDAVGKNVFPFGHVVAMDGVCSIVHPSNPVTKLTIQQVQDIYTGKTTNWRQLGGPDAKIIPVSRDTSSGTYETFNTFVMKKVKMAGHVEYVSTNPQAFARVETTKGAIAYVGYGFIQPGVKAVTLNNVVPTIETILSGRYPVSRPLYMYTNGFPKLGTMAHKFVTFHLTEKGQEVVEDKGFVPVTQY